LEVNGTTLFSSKSFPIISAGPQRPQKLTALKIDYEKFGPQILNTILKLHDPHEFRFSKMYLPQKSFLFQ